MTLVCLTLQWSTIIKININETNYFSLSSKAVTMLAPAGSPTKPSVEDALKGKMFFTHNYKHQREVEKLPCNCLPISKLH